MVNAIDARGVTRFMKPGVGRQGHVVLLEFTPAIALAAAKAFERRRKPR